MTNNYIKNVLIVFCVFLIKNCFSSVDISNDLTRKKPPFISRSDYEYGKCLHVVVDQNACLFGVGLGVSTRTLVALSQCGTKFESFVSSVVRPGTVKCLLFWGPTFLGYKYILAVKHNEMSHDKNRQSLQHP